MKASSFVIPYKKPPGREVDNNYRAQFQPSSYTYTHPPIYNGLNLFNGPTSSLNLAKSKNDNVIPAIRPSSMPHEEFTRLSKSERKRLSHPCDTIIRYNNKEFILPYSQLQDKIQKHGAILGLDYKLTKLGATKILRTHSNILKMRDCLKEFFKQPTIKYIEGTYQGNTSRSIDAIHFFDKRNDIIVTFEKSSRRFITICQITNKERNDPMINKNFGGSSDKSWFRSEVKNLPPRPNMVFYGNNQNLPTTPRNFENEVISKSPNDLVSLYTDISTNTTSENKS